MTTRIFFLISLFFLINLQITNLKGATPTKPVMQWATHVDITETATITGAGSSDWCFSIKKSMDGGYIACGYSQIYDGTHVNVGPSIIKLDPAGNVLWHREFDPGGTASYGALTEIVEAPNGNLGAVGYQQSNPNPNNAIFILTDKDGILLNGSSMIVPNIFATNDQEARKLCVAPDGKFLFTLRSKKVNIDCSFIEKTDGYTYSIQWFSSTYYGVKDYYLDNIKIGNVTSSTDYDVIVGGFHILNTTTITGNDKDGNAIPARDVPETDIDLYRLRNNSGVWSTTWLNVYPNSLFSTLYYDDKGPYNPDGTTGSSCSPGVSTFLDNWFHAPSLNVPAEVIVSDQPSKDIALLAYVNLVWPGDAHAYFSATNGVDDCIRGVTYNELKDAQGFVLRVDYATGNVLALPNNNPIHVGHYSGDDFRLGMVEDKCGNLLVTGTMAANDLGVNSTDLTVPPLEDALVTKISQNHDRIWRRNFNAPGLHTGGGLTENCPFAIAFNPDDNSVIIAGNNGERDDDYIFIKLTDDEQLNYPWANSAAVTDIFGSTVWNTSTNIKGRVIVHNGATLTIDNCTIEFGETREMNDYNASSIQLSGIWVQKGGRLIVRNNAILKGLSRNTHSNCSRDYMWDGITLEGDPNKDEGLSNQGTIALYNTPTIQDARCGIRCDSKTFFNNQPETLLTADVTWDRGRLSYPQAEGKGGGWIFADHANFVNNRKDVEFLPYTYMNNSSTFYYCNFNCNNHMVDPDFVYWDYLQNKNVPAGVNTHVSMWDVHDIPFRGDLFNNTGGQFLPEYRGAGLSTINADYSIYGDSRFEYLSYGIHASDFNSTATLSAINCHFINNSKGIYNLGINFQTYVNNEFRVGLNFKDYGMYLEDCTDYTVQQNDFINDNIPDYPSHGIIDYFSVPNHNNNLIRKNTFQNFFGSAIWAGGFHNDGNFNSVGLQIQCNEYTSNVYDEYTPDVGLGSGQGIAYPQGGNTSNSAANNSFITSCTVTDGELYDESVPNVNTYRYNHCPGYPFTPTGGCFTSGWVFPSNIVFPFDPTQDCLSLFRLGSRDDKRSELENNKNQELLLKQIINGGNKSVLINSINSSNTSQAMSMLRAASPYVSDDVLSLAIRSGIFPDDSLNTLLELNSPLPSVTMQSLIADVSMAGGNIAPDLQLTSNTISTNSTEPDPEVQVQVNSVNIQTQSALSVEISASSINIVDPTVESVLPDSMQSISQSPIEVEMNSGNQILTPVNTDIGKLRLDKNGISRSDSLNSLISHYELEQSRNFDELVDLFLSDTTINGLDSVILMLQNETSVNRKVQLVNAYMTKGDFTHASQTLTSLQQYPDLSNFISLENNLISLHNQNKTLFEIKNDPTLYGTLQSISNDSTHSGYSSARAILSLIDDKYYPEVIVFNEASPAFRKRKEEIAFTNGYQLLRNFPNPFENSTTIEVQVNDKLASPQLIIYDVVGKIVVQYKINNGFNEVHVSSSVLRPGTYFYSLVSENKRIETQKMICTQ